VVNLLLQSRFPMFVAWASTSASCTTIRTPTFWARSIPPQWDAASHDIWSEIWPDISPLIDAAMDGQATYREDLPLLMNRKGYDEQTWFTFSYSPVRDETGQVAGMFCACKETTEIVATERALRASEERLREAGHRKDEFLAMLAHELRNPLAPIRMASS
jgi:signal transduction histidine kinase